MTTLNVFGQSKADAAAPVDITRAYDVGESFLIDIPSTGTFTDANGVKLDNDSQVYMVVPGGGIPAIVDPANPTPAEIAALDVVDGPNDAFHLGEFADEAAALTDAAADGRIGTTVTINAIAGSSAVAGSPAVDAVDAVAGVPLVKGDSVVWENLGTHQVVPKRFYWSSKASYDAAIADGSYLVASDFSFVADEAGTSWQLYDHLGNAQPNSLNFVGVFATQAAGAAVAVNILDVYAVETVPDTGTLAVAAQPAIPAVAAQPEVLASPSKRMWFDGTDLRAFATDVDTDIIPATDGMALEWGKSYALSPAHNYTWPKVTEDYGTNWLLAVPTVAWSNFTGVWTTDGTDTIGETQDSSAFGDQQLLFVGRIGQHAAGVNNIELSGAKGAGSSTPVVGFSLSSPTNLQWGNKYILDPATAYVFPAPTGTDDWMEIIPANHDWQTFVPATDWTTAGATTLGAGQVDAISSTNTRLTLIGSGTNIEVYE